ncbi:MAG TPA: hypothetical protein V6D16_00425 [Candidatus Obscuribacterales bacterium]
MVEPTTAFTAGAIAKLAFDEFVKAGAGDLAKKSLSGAITQINELRKKIWNKFRGDAKAEKALVAIEQEGSEAALTKLEVYLDDVMIDDPAFKQELQQLAQQITNIGQVQDNTQMNQNNYDNSKGYQVKGDVEHLGDNYAK